MATVSYTCPDCGYWKGVEVPEWMIEEHHTDVPYCTSCGEWMEVDTDNH
jgi:predicted RNA-binding Zn-ribbon protein involved in translation (DUF1610 family)